MNWEVPPPRRCQARRNPAGALDIGSLRGDAGKSRWRRRGNHDWPRATRRFLRKFSMQLRPAECRRACGCRREKRLPESMELPTTEVTCIKTQTTITTRAHLRFIFVIDDFNARIWIASRSFTFRPLVCTQQNTKDSVPGRWLMVGRNERRDRTLMSSERRRRGRWRWRARRRRRCLRCLQYSNIPSIQSIHFGVTGVRRSNKTGAPYQTASAASSS